MWLRFVVFAACFGLATSAALFAQRGRQGGGMGGSQRQPSTAGQPRESRQQPTGLSSEERQRIRASKKQRDQHQLATQAVNRIRTRAREMVRAARVNRFNLQLFRRQYAELQNELSLMQEEHERLMAELGEEQRAATQDRNREMEKELEEIDVWIEAMDAELEEPSPDRKELEKESRKIERAAKKLEDDYRSLASDLSID